MGSGSRFSFLGRRSQWGAFAAVLLIAGTAAALVPTTAADRGWAPLVTLAGSGDRGAAIRGLGRFTTIMEAVVKHLTYDEETEEFVTNTIETLADFDLHQFYMSLPEEYRGWRRLTLMGEVKDGKYLVRRPGKKKDFEVRAISIRNDPGDASAVMRVKQVPVKDERPNYLMHGRFGIGIGDLGWSSMVGAGTQIVSEFGGEKIEGDPVPSAATLAKVRKAFPKLKANDGEIVGVMWEAFPATVDLLSKLGTLTDVVADADDSADYAHVNIKMRLLKKRMKKQYEGMSDYLDGLDRLMKARVRWVDLEGRNLMVATFDTYRLEATLEMYSRGGRILPFSEVPDPGKDKKGKAKPKREPKVYVNNGVDPMGSALSSSTFKADAVLDVMGLKVDLKGVRADLNYRPTMHEARVSGSVTKMPKVTVGGAALGFVGPGFIDVFIPSNLHDIFNNFLRTAVKGNEGRGLALALTVGQPGPGQAGAIETNLGLEILDNYFLKMGMAVVTNQLIPDDDAVESVKKLANDGHDAFVKDFKAYAAQ